MRARLAVASSGLTVELREIVLRDKALEFLETSLKATVPVVVLPDGKVLEESLDIMEWALGCADPEALLSDRAVEMRALVDSCETEFKPHLDRFKYHVRYEAVNLEKERQLASAYLRELDDRLRNTNFLFGNQISFAGIGIAPFVRQFANTDREWFDQQSWPDLLRWLDAFLESDRFQRIMQKYPKWKMGDRVTVFPAAIEKSI